LPTTTRDNPQAMEDDKSGAKYAKLLTEYSKVSFVFVCLGIFFLISSLQIHQLRAQAKVLKNAVLEEKNKVSVLQESLRIKDQNLRRAETELDSVNFRNKQLEHRVQVFQEDMQLSIKGSTSKSNKSRDNQLTGNRQMDPIIVEELHKRIMENAHLSSSVRFVFH
jgi:Predicted coiled-coil domain-containing protein